MHTCPDCAEACTCGGDIEDMEWGEDLGCVHCSALDDDFEEDDDWEDGPMREGQTP